MAGLELPKNEYPIYRQTEIKNLSAFFITLKKEKTDMFRARPIDSSHFLCMRRAADRCLCSKKTRCNPVQCAYDNQI